MGEVKSNWTANTDKAIANLQRLVNAQAEQINKLREGKDAAGQFDEAMGAIGARVAQFVSLTGLISTAVGGLRELDEIRRRAGEGLSGEEANQKRLAQIATDASDLDRMQYLAQRISNRYGIERDEATGLVFQGRSLQLDSQQILETAGYKRFAADVSPLFEATAGIRAAFGAQAAGGTQESITNALLSAAKETKVGVEDIARVTLGPAQSVKALGGTAEETLAALSVATVALASPEEASTAVGRFADVLRRDERFAGTGFRESLRTFAAMSPEEQSEILGENVRARRGAGVLVENLAQFDRTYGKITGAIGATGTTESEVYRATTIAQQDEELSAIEMGRAATVATESLRRRRRGPTELRKDAIKQILAQTLDDLDEGHDFIRAIDTMSAEKTYDLWRWFGAGEDFLARGAAQSIHERTGIPVEQIMERFERAMQRFEGGTEKIEKMSRERALSVTSVNE